MLPQNMSRVIKHLKRGRRQIHWTRNYEALNKFGVDLLPESYNRVLFDNVKTVHVSDDIFDASLSDLDKFGLNTGGTQINLPDVTNLLPQLRGNNVLEHFDNISSEQVAPYLNILSKLTELQDVPAPPKEWRLDAGWTRYGFDGTVESVAHPLEDALVFDVEVSMKTDLRAVMATCVSDQAWYSWLSPHFLSESGFPADMTPDTLIPVGSSSRPKLIIGHNVSYDRIRVGDEYSLELSGTRYLDTMSMHIAYSGMTSSQRMLKAGETKIEKSKRPMWLDRTSLNNLAAVHQHYCKPEAKMDKDVRSSFVTQNLEELKKDIPSLLTYCANDVLATLEVVQVLTPKFLMSCKHPSTLSGILTMSTAYLPTNNAWESYIQSAGQEYYRMEKEMQSMLEKEVWSALQLLDNDEFKKDPWLWDLEWKPASKRSKKRKLLERLLGDEVDNERDYPEWFQDLVDELEGTPYLNITTSKRVVPKVLRLTWKGFPIHFDSEHKWGYLVPSDNVQDVLDRVKIGEIKTNFPLEEYLESVSSDKTAGYKQSTDIFIDQIADFSEKSTISSNNISENAHGKELDVGIPGVIFYKLPHKNGPNYRVGNPLGKDFLSACSEGGALASKIKNLAGDLLKINSRMVYWRNSRDRVMEQMKVDLPDQGHSAILPSLVVCGTVTRRAVEKTWLTASNAKENRIGSELKTAIRCPPGYSFVGADVDSQELWLASVLGDSERGGHGATPLGWMSLQGEKSRGTDLHSKTAAAAQVTRDQAKVLNYARIYGAGEPFARLLLKQFNPTLTENEAASRARHMYEQTKGLRGYKLNDKGRWLYDLLMTDSKYDGSMVSKKLMNLLTKKMVFLNRIVKESKKVKHKDKILLVHVLTEEGKELFEEFSPQSKVGDKNILLDDSKLRDFHDYLEKCYGNNCRSDYNVMNSLIHQTIWFGGSESHTFNRLEGIAMSSYPRTPVLGAKISRALDTQLIGRNYLPSRINWVVQSTAVDFLHLLLVSMQWLMQELDIKGRYCISIHDEVRYLVRSEDRYKAALAMHLSNLLVRSHVVSSLGLNTLPASIAYFSSVDVDTVLRKEPNSDCVTPSNPLGLERGHNIPPGEGLDIFQTIKKLQQSNDKLDDKLDGKLDDMLDDKRNKIHENSS